MAKISLCDRCNYYAHTNLLVCAVHPYGPEWGVCSDFISAELWEPDDPKSYDPEMESECGWHPIFTGKCPECRTSFSRMRLPHSNGAVNVVVGKMISKPSLPRLRLDYSLRSTPYTSRPLTLLIVSSIAAEAAMISRSSPPRYKRPKLPTATISKILIEAAFSASLAAKAA